MGKIGFIGLGSQGGPMAHRIVDAGLPLVVWARRPEVVMAYTDKGATAASSVHNLGEQCETVGVCVVNDNDVLDICRQLIPAMKPGARIAIHSTVLPETCAELEKQCAARSIGLIDAPVSGGSPSAEAGTLTVMCGGDPEVFEACKPVFETFGKLIVLLGPIGSGQRAKIVNNAMMAANFGVAQAATSAALALGLDRAAFNQLISASSGRSYAFDVYARLPSPAAFSIGGPLLKKDVGLLRSILPDEPGAKLLGTAADPFLDAATGG
jgi:3-hydroxyisobutyrate dehydrogenase-like beta-hydroxyacid dehydrogenase